MEIYCEEFNLTPSQRPRGYYKSKQAAAPTANEEHIKPINKESRDARVKRDLSVSMEDQIPTCPVSHSAPAIHREKVHMRRWPINACVARPFTKKELLATPDALTAREKKWGRLVDKEVFDMTNVQE